MTAPKIGEEIDIEEDDEKPTDLFEEKDEYEDLNNMLADVINVQQQVRQGNDDLAEIRKLVHMTKTNINCHINTVDTLKTSLQSIN